MGTHTTIGQYVSFKYFPTQKLCTYTQVLCEKIGEPAMADAKFSDTPANDVWRTKHPVLRVLEFNRERKSMSVLVSNGAANAAVGTLLIKGATEMVLSR
jgi:hypothetical protein